MKFKITMKDPDGFHDSVTEAIKDMTRGIEGITEDEREAMEESRRETLNGIARQWFEYNEYVTIEIDTDAMTATVCNR